MAYLFTVIALLVLCIVISLRKSIRTAIDVIKVGSDALRHLPSMLLFPLTNVVAMAIFMVGTAGEGPRCVRRAPSPGGDSRGVAHPPRPLTGADVVGVRGCVPGYCWAAHGGGRQGRDQR